MEERKQPPIAEISQKCIPVKLKDIRNLARFAAIMVSAGHSAYILHFTKDQKHIYGLLAVIRDYYKLYGLPIFYYVVSSKKIDGNYILVKLDFNREEVEYSNGIRPGWIHVPVITLEKPPPFIEV